MNRDEEERRCKIVFRIAMNRDRNLGENFEKPFESFTEYLEYSLNILELK